MFNVDRNIILTEDGINLVKLKEITKKFISDEVPNLKKLHDAYNREINDEIQVNMHKYITDTLVSYVVGIPVAYSNISTDLEDNYIIAEEDSENYETAKLCSIYGRAFEYLYIDEDDNIAFTPLETMNTFIIKSNDIVPKNLIGCYYTETYDIKGNLEQVTLLCYTADRCYKYTGKDIDGLQLAEEEEHYFGGIPILELLNNNEAIGDFVDVMGLIKAYETLQTDRLHDKNAFINKLLVVINSSLGDTDEEVAYSRNVLKKGGILELEDIDANCKSDAKFISQTFDEANVETLKKSLLQDIMRISRCPDLSSEDAFAGNTSGIAMKYHLLNTELIGQTKERFMIRFLRNRINLINNIYSLKGKGFDASVIDINFTRNIPTSKEELLQELQATEGILSLETRLMRYDSELDVKEEMKKLQAEKENNMKLVENSFGNYHYNTTTEINEDEDNNEEDN